MTDSWLSTKNVCRFYQRQTSVVRAVDSVSLSVDRGDFVSLVGSSGSGKSTLLNLLAGYYPANRAARIDPVASLRNE